MTTVQIIGIAVASAAAVLLVVAIVVTRRHGGENDAQPGPSFLDEAPQDTFAVLGKAEQPVEDITLDPALERARSAAHADAAEAAPAAPEAEIPPAAAPKADGLGLDWGPDRSLPETALEPAVAPVWGEEDTETTGVLRLDEQVVPPSHDVLPPLDAESGDREVASEPARPAEGGSAVAGVAASESGSGDHLVPLSDIIVTTSAKMVDLHDPEVRRMLTELVTFEIDQAADFRRQGLSIDAVLQLTEAEKVSRALGMTESARRIHEMMEEIRRED